MKYVGGMLLFAKLKNTGKYLNFFSAGIRMKCFHKLLYNLNFRLISGGNFKHMVLVGLCKFKLGRSFWKRRTGGFLSHFSHLTIKCTPPVCENVEMVVRTCLHHLLVMTVHLFTVQNEMNLGKMWLYMLQ